jgi:1-acyl-sn-glycerol-3-phosphate acyltransferase
LLALAFSIREVAFACAMDANSKIRALWDGARTVGRSAQRTVGVFGRSTGVALAYAGVAVQNDFDIGVAGKWTQIWAEHLRRGIDVGVDVRGDVPGDEGVLIVCNHRSYVDIAVIGSLVPASFIAKAEIRHWPVLGLPFRLSSSLFVDRGNRESGRKTREEVRRRLAAGLSIINFAEGTTYDGDGMLPFRPGLFKVVAGMPVTVVPATIRYTGQGERTVEWVRGDWFLNHFLLLAGHENMRAEVRFLESVRADAYEDAAELMVDVRRRMLADLGAADDTGAMLNHR